MASGDICLAPRKIPSPLGQCPWLATVPAALGEIINPPADRRARSHRFNRLECAAIRCRLRFLTLGTGASLIAPLREIAKHGSDRLLISHRHRGDHRCELGPGQVRAQPNRVFLEDAILALEQPFEIYTVLLGELSDLVMLELQDRLDLFVGKITRCG
jgi:hypothetical protein